MNNINDPQDKAPTEASVTKDIDDDLDEPLGTPQACNLGDGECESCQ